MVASMVANTARDSKKHREPFVPSDFMPQDADAKLKPADSTALKAKAAMIFGPLSDANSDQGKVEP